MNQRDWGQMTIVKTHAPQNATLEGRMIGELAAEQGRHPMDVMFDLVVSDDLNTVLLSPRYPRGERRRRLATAR